MRTEERQRLQGDQAGAEEANVPQQLGRQEEAEDETVEEGDGAENHGCCCASP